MEIIIKENITFTNFEKYQEKLSEIIKNSDTPISIRFDEKVFLDSSGIGVLIYCHKLNKDKFNIKKLQLFNLNNLIIKAFKLARLDTIFQFEN